VPDRGWKRRFDDPIPLPRGRRLVTLEDAGTYITKLPKSEHTTPEWQAAMEGLDPGGDGTAGQRCLRALALCER
jgi:hypothetical protein